MAENDYMLNNEVHVEVFIKEGVEFFGVQREKVNRLCLRVALILLLPG